MDLSRGIAYGRHAGLEKYYMYSSTKILYGRESLVFIHEFT